MQRILDQIYRNDDFLNRIIKEINERKDFCLIIRWMFDRFLLPLIINLSKMNILNAERVE